MFYSQVILAKKGPLAKVWLAAHWGDKKLARPQIFATDISQSCTDIMNPSVPLALRLSGHLLLGVVRIYSRKVKYVLNDCTEAMLKLQMAFAKQSSNSGKGGPIPLDANGNPMGQLGSRELLNETDANAAHQLVANFGEFDQVHVVEGFCLPLPEDNEWILADESGNAYSIGGLGGGGGATASVDGDGSSSRDPGLLLAAHINTNTNTNTNLRTNGDEHDDEEEEAWAPFDPDNEDEEDDNDNINMPNNSRVSDIEIVRAANDSLLSEDQTRRASTSFLDKSALTTDTPVGAGAGASASANPAEDDYDFNVPFGEDDSEDENGNGNGNPNANANANTPFGAANLDDSALQLSRDGGTPLGANGLALAMDDDDENDSQANAKRLSSEIAASTTKPPPRKRRRKRRKVVIDNHETELTNDHIRTMLQHTDDIVAVMIHPASLWDEEDHRKDYKTLALEERAKQQLEQQQQQQDGGKSKRKRKKKNGAKNNDPDAVPCLTRPFLADGSGPSLHPVLQRLWQDNYWKALGEPCPYQKQEAEDDDDKVVDDVEKVRRDARAEDDESTLGGEGSDLDVTKEKMDEENLSQSQLPEADFDFPTAVDDEEEEDDDAPVPDFGDDDDETAALHKAGNDNDNDNDNGDLLDLGMVNDMILDSDEDNDEDDEDANRQALGELSSSSTKWHKHTVRVFQHLKKCLHDPNNAGANANDADIDIDADDASSTEPQPESVGFDELTKHVVSRRNASSIFFEMLQLKTWDFIELNQDESYGSIAISAGVRFGEDAPNN